MEIKVVSHEEMKKIDLTDCEVRAGYYGHMLVTSEMIEMQRFEIAMKQHYRELQEEHDLQIHALKLQAEMIRNRPRIFGWFW